MKKLVFILTISLVFVSCIHEKEANLETEKSNSFRSNQPIQMDSPNVSVEAVKTDTSEMQLVIRTNSIYLNEHGVKTNFANLKEVDAHFEKIKDIKFKNIMFIVSKELDSLSLKEVVRLIDKYKFQSLKFVSTVETQK